MLIRDIYNKCQKNSQTYVLAPHIRMVSFKASLKTYLKCCVCKLSGGTETAVTGICIK